MDMTSNPVGPERTLHVERIMDVDNHAVEYRLDVHHRIRFPVDDPKAWFIPEEFIAAMLSDALREFVNNRRCTDVIQRYIPYEDEPCNLVSNLDEED